jgi:uncharacterized protein (DUF305 family)
MEWMGEPVPLDAQPGMATPQQMDELAAATGDDLDDLFTSLMIEHHQGGIHMAQYAADHGHESAITDLADAIVTTQESEIAEMNLQREALGLDPV